MHAIKATIAKSIDGVPPKISIKKIATATTTREPKAALMFAWRGVQLVLVDSIFYHHVCQC
ncbi:hypothetical protein JCM19239_2006 [Vibrio variabilis]|uniref:Uncharacterized protein n=1 Tax=Vibrio variabilis TaxID=990271 RepID=A0ABQ0J705_9VIBR|nr:hypothetical protein JCM19239_2006 [Vibrio variabilis]